jgi:hypothetical protein
MMKRNGKPPVIPTVTKVMMMNNRIMTVPRIIGSIFFCQMRNVTSVRQSRNMPVNLTKGPSSTIDGSNPMRGSTALGKNRKGIPRSAVYVAM